MSPSRPKKPADPRVKPHAVTESVAPAVHQANPLPQRPLGDDLVERALREVVEGPCDLGPEIPQDRPAELQGPAQVIRFPAFWKAWAAGQTPETLAALDVLSRRQIRKTIVRQIVKENWARASAAGGFVFMAVQYGAEILGWIQAHLPAIQGAWRLVKTGIAP